MMPQTISSSKGINITLEDADKLIRSGNGNACLYYLCANFCGQDSVAAISKQLGWTQEKALAARTALEAIGLCDSLSSEPPLNENMPSYTPNEINTVAEGDPVFSTLIEYTKIRLNRILTPTDLRTLLGLYNHLGLPAGVIMLLVSYTVENVRKRRGQTARVGMAAIEREGFYWHRLGIVTEARAEEYIREKTEEDNKILSMASLLNIRGRTPTVTEEKYLKKWSSYGMDSDVLYTAYDRTVTNTGSLRWKYMDRILESWHTKGIRTSADLMQKERQKAVSPMEYSTKDDPRAAGNATDSTSGASNVQHIQTNSDAIATENAAERLKRIRASRGNPPRDSESR
jgi:DnaD/phage-associated family protein